MTDNSHSIDPGCSDEHLIQLFRASRSHGAFEQLARRHSGWIWSIARRRLRDDHLADDVTQVVFMLLARHISSLRDGTRLAAWLTRTAHYTILHALRSRIRGSRLTSSRDAADVQLSALASSEPAIIAQKNDALVTLDAAIATLPSADRDLIARRFYQQQSFDQIASTVGISADAARKRLDRVISRLHNKLGKEFGNETRALFPSLAIIAIPGIDSLARASKLSAITTTALGTSTTVTPQCAALYKGTLAMLTGIKLRIASITALGVILASVAVYAACGGGANQHSVAPPPSLPLPQVQVATIPAAASPMVPNRTEIDNGITVLFRLSIDRTKLIGYSYLTGTWSVAPVKDPVLAFKNTTMGAMATTFEGDTVLAFSATTGEWVAVSTGGPADIPPEIHHQKNVVVAVHGNKIMAFGDKSAEWSSISFSAPPASGKGKPEISSQDKYALATQGNELRAFSADSGEWRSAPIGENLSPPHIILGRDIAFASQGNTVLAFSNTRGSWSSMTLTTAIDTRKLQQSNDLSVGANVTLKLKDKLYIFSDSAGKWSELP